MFECRHWDSRTCFNGMDCPFAHSESELLEQPSLQATGLCYEFARTGRCRKGRACNFAHGKHELRSVLPARKRASVAPVASPCTPQNTGLDPRVVQSMVKQLHELEKMVANMMLELQKAGSPGHGLEPAHNNCGEHLKTGTQRFQYKPESMWL